MSASTTSSTSTPSSIPSLHSSSLPHMSASQQLDMQLQSDATQQWQSIRRQKIARLVRNLLLVVSIGLVLVAACVYYACVVVWPAVPLTWRPVQFPVDSNVLSLSRGAGKYSLPWLEPSSLPLPKPPRDWILTQDSPSEALRAVDRAMEQMRHSCARVHHLVDATNRKLLHVSLPTAHRNVEVVLAGLQHDPPWFQLGHWAKQTSQYDAALANTITLLQDWLQHYSEHERAFENALEKSRGLRAAVLTALNSTAHTIFNCTSETSIRESYNKCLDSSRPTMAFLKAVHTWHSFLDLNLYVAHQRFSATTFFLNQTLLEISDFRANTQCATRECVVEYLQELEHLILKGKQSDLTRTAYRAGLLASKFWARYHEVQRQRLKADFKSWVRESNDPNVGIQTVWWQVYALEWVRDMIFLPSTPASHQAFEPRICDWDAETPYRVQTVGAFDLFDKDETQDTKDGDSSSEEYEDDDEGPDTIHYPGLLSDKGFPAHQTWQQYKPKLNGQRCLLLPLLQRMRMLRLGNMLDADADADADAAREAGPTTFVSPARAFISHYQFAMDSFAKTTGSKPDDLSRIFCIVVPYSDRDLGAETPHPGTEADIWAERQTAGVMLESRERFLLDHYK